jgi:uncharacterized membrane protein
MTKKQRIWEIDALRGLCILFMIVIHFVFDLNEFAGKGITPPAWFLFLRTYGHVLFVLISGISATLGSRSFKRGVMVFCAGLLITATTLFMIYVLDYSEQVLIQFGILHMLGICMMLYPLFKRLPFWALGAIGAACIALGFWFAEGSFQISVPFLFPFGLPAPQFFSADYFPIFPGLGWFLLGAAIGKTLYKRKITRLPKIKETLAPIRLLRYCGQHSLELYLLHQPVLFAITYLFFI